MYMDKLKPKTWEITINPTTRTIQVEVEKKDTSLYYYDCLDIELSALEDYAKKMGYLDSRVEFYDWHNDEPVQQDWLIPFDDWMRNRSEFDFMMFVLNYLYDKKVIPC